MYQSFLDSKEVYQILNGDMQVGLTFIAKTSSLCLCSLCWPMLRCKDKEGGTLSQGEDFQEQDFPYSLFNLLTDEYQFISLVYRHLCVFMQSWTLKEQYLEVASVELNIFAVYILLNPQ